MRLTRYLPLTPLNLRARLQVPCRSAHDTLITLLGSQDLASGLCRLRHLKNLQKDRIPRFCSLVPSPLSPTQVSTSMNLTMLSLLLNILDWIILSLLLLNINKLDQSNPTSHAPHPNNSHRPTTDSMSNTVYNSHGISIIRVERKCTPNTTSGVPIRRIYILIKAGQTTLLQLTETLGDGKTVAPHREVLLYGKWSVSQSLNAPTSTVTTDALPPAYSMLASATSSAEPAKDTETTIRVTDYTVAGAGAWAFLKCISIVSGQTPSSQLQIKLGMAADLEAGLVSPNPGCPVLYPGSIPRLEVVGSWNLRQHYLATPPAAQPTNATTPSFFRRMSARIKTLGSSGPRNSSRRG